MIISWSKCSSGGLPARSCSTKLLPRWRSVSQNSTERWAKSVAYCDQFDQMSQGDIGLASRSVMCSPKAFFTRSL